MKERIKLNILFLIILFTQVNGVTEVLELLTRGFKEKQMPNNNTSDTILVLGSTSSERSTLIHYLVGDPTEMTAVEDDGTGMKILWPDISSTELHTPFPIITTDNRSCVWVSVPDFRRAGSPAAEIAATYFTKRITDAAEKFKIVFAANYASVVEGNDPSDFLNMITAGTGFLNNIDQFNVSLVLTKVPLSYLQSGEIIDVSDGAVIKNTARSLRSYLKILRNDQKANAVKIALMNKFLHQSGGKFDRIGLFYQPDVGGKLSEMERIKTGRHIILNIIQCHTSGKSVASDFGYSLSAEAEAKTYEMHKHVVNNISETLARIDDELAIGLMEKNDANDDNYLERRQTYFAAAANLYQSRIAGSVTLDGLVEGIRRLSTQMNITVKESQLENLKTQEKYIEVLGSIRNMTISRPWNMSLPKAHKGIMENVAWYTFYHNMISKLTSYGVQKDTTLYNVQHLSHWGTPNRPQGIHIDQSNINQFFSIMGLNYTLQASISMTATKYHVLNLELNRLLRSVRVFECKDDTIVYKNWFIVLSNIDPAQCRNAKKVHIVAFGELFLDANVSFRGVRELVAVARKWNVIGPVTIDLSALNNSHQHRPNMNGTRNSPQGIRGHAGLPGDNGANFYGYAELLVNGQWLTVDISGGKGGRGQDGSSAYPESADLDKYQLESYRNCDMKKYLQRTGSYRHVEGEDIPECDDYEYYYYVQIFMQDVAKKTGHNYTLYGRQCCRDNGAAGIGGFGGLPGAKVIEIMEKSGGDPRFVEHNGEVGMNGENAGPCRETKTKFTFITKCKRDIYLVELLEEDPFKKCKFRFKYYRNEPDDLCPSKARLTTFNDNDRGFPEKPTKSAASIFNEYKAKIKNKRDSS